MTVSTVFSMNVWPSSTILGVKGSISAVSGGHTWLGAFLQASVRRSRRMPRFTRLRGFGCSNIPQRAAAAAGEWPNLKAAIGQPPLRQQLSAPPNPDLSLSCVDPLGWAPNFTHWCVAHADGKFPLTHRNRADGKLPGLRAATLLKADRNSLRMPERKIDICFRSARAMGRQSKRSFRRPRMNTVSRAVSRSSTVSPFQCGEESQGMIISGNTHGEPC
jgi:hypothetical protein